MRKRFYPHAFILLFIILIVGIGAAIFQSRQDKQTITSRAQSYPPGFQEIQIAGGLTQPTTMEFLPDGSLLVAEKGGSLRVVSNGALLPQPFLKVSVKSDGERGLLGVTVDPEFNSNKYVYIYYTDSGRSVNRVVRYTADAANPYVAAAGSETVILDNIPSQAGYHNGGALHFGIDGKLYIAVGEGHSSSNSQSMGTLAGKLLRINKDGSIPEDNPFYQSASGNNRMIYALGLRNPFTFAINPVDGRIFVNDVGGGKVEEVNDVQRGGNYGWPTCEGKCTQGFINPIHEYPRSVGRAITGGVFYTGAGYPQEYRGNYFFADYLGNWIKVLNTANNQVSNFVSGLQSPVDLRVGRDGQIYYLTYSKGAVYRIQYGNSQVPTQGVSAPVQSTSIQATITLPAEGAKYSAGDSISYEGSATDTQDGALAASAFRWKIETVHDDNHTHPFADWVEGSKTGTFKTGITGETAANIKYRIYLSVKNSRNEMTEVSRDVLPNNTVMEFLTEPAGLELTIDGAPRKTPFTVEGVAGFEREIGASPTTTIDGRTFSFTSWSDGGAGVHKILTPKEKTVYKAVYMEGILNPTTYCLGPCAGSITPTNAAGGAISGMPTSSAASTSVPAENQNITEAPVVNQNINNPAPTSTAAINGGRAAQGGNGLILKLLELIQKILELILSMLKSLI